MGVGDGKALGGPTQYVTNLQPYLSSLKFRICRQLCLLLSNKNYIALNTSHESIMAILQINDQKICHIGF